MVLIFGGAYQGKLEYALSRFDISSEDVFFCKEDTSKLDYSAQVICGLEKFVMNCVREGQEAKDVLAANRKQLQDKIIIVTDISQGVVPVDPVQRSWREMVGRTMLYLGGEADQVIRIFCGLGQVIKP